MVRPNITKMKGYSSARSESSGKEGIFLDANENPYGIYNRYPDPIQNSLKSIIAAQKSTTQENIFVGNGSDEAIDLLIRIFCRPSKDKIITFRPSYDMYSVSAEIQDIQNISIGLSSSFQIDRRELAQYLQDEELKLIFICSPNNPTGNTIHKKDLFWILEKFRGILIIDEAYVDFTVSPSFVKEINSYKNLVVLQTMSKSIGAAGLRIGLAFSNSEIIKLMNKIKPPYNVSQLNQEAAIDLLKKNQQISNRINSIVANREIMEDKLKALSIVKKIYPSESNFVLVEFIDACRTYNYLRSQNIIVRNQNHKIKNCLRITIGSQEENIKLITALKQYTQEQITFSEYGFKSSPDLINRH